MMKKRNFIILMIFLISISALLIPKTFSKYTKSATKQLTISIRKPHYKIKFNANGGSGTMNDMNFVYGTAQNLVANSFERDECTFDRWNTETDGSGTDYTVGQEINNLNSTEGYILNLYAMWKCNIYFQLPSDWNTYNDSSEPTVYTYLYSDSGRNYNYDYPDNTVKAQKIDATKNIFSFQVEAGANLKYDHVIFNRINNRKTGDLEIDNNTIGKIFVPELYQNGNTSATSVRVLFKGSSSKPNNIYMFNSTAGTQNAAWPGVEMTDRINDDSRYFVIDKTLYEYMIFNNGSGTNQTNDLPLPSYQDITYKITGNKQHSASRQFYLGSWHNYQDWLSTDYATWNSRDNQEFANAQNNLHY